MTIKIILKNGVSFDVKCSHFSLDKTFGQLNGYTFDGITENKPVYLDLDQVAAIVRVMSDED